MDDVESMWMQVPVRSWVIAVYSLGAAIGPALILTAFDPSPMLLVIVGACTAVACYCAIVDSQRTVVGVLSRMHSAEATVTLIDMALGAASPCARSMSVHELRQSLTKLDNAQVYRLERRHLCRLISLVCRELDDEVASAALELILRAGDAGVVPALERAAASVASQDLRLRIRDCSSVLMDKSRKNADAAILVRPSDSAYHGAGRYLRPHMGGDPAHADLLQPVDRTTVGVSVAESEDE